MVCAAYNKTPTQQIDSYINRQDIFWFAKTFPQGCLAQIEQEQLKFQDNCRNRSCFTKKAILWFDAEDNMKGKVIYNQKFILISDNDTRTVIEV